MEGSRKVPPSVLNLAHWIPQRDIRKLIWDKYLNMVDRDMIYVAHNRQHTRLLKFVKNICADVAREGHLELDFKMGKKKWMSLEYVCLFASR